ncbi:MULTISPECIES: DUF5134 domain-containing protein [unclassified Saccharopolyspora]|uniref:DUF5134 domain-containing protein n=1 Tax=unclassified Saccharopolyspora TaxID=2646250 RepID=UPI001CD557C4|nr:MULTISPECIES: DUF5134 domain-containing protein [unclassified Saccharopolyspora]MCA1189000.1 DUF5134 domain-containing protein [Saccharopolyspora sp. 6T]MCA1191202.1 DUF5134 domain-containing protein [Saccharopolyspora sp. 6V]MCA1229874.1 DUF5134 domain-containing protein [Saccharopolyspora sp. 6M]MCA1281906.1 DUF5134 domain-containing protein [Saccharopolyspora sp. 7B]
MVESLLLSWVLTVLFAVTAVWCAISATRPGLRPSDRLSSASHLAMSLLMIAMVWPWGMGVPATPQLVLFAATAVWFAALAVLRVPCAHGYGSPRLAHAHHAVMSVAMVWMVAAMPLLMLGAHDSGGGHHHHAAGAPASGVLAAPAAAAGPPAPVVLVSAVLGAFLVLSSVAWISTAVDTARHNLNTADATGAPADPRATRLAWDAACHGAMSIGMGAMLLAML